jgi:hypothetical protein
MTISCCVSFLVVVVQLNECVLQLTESILQIQFHSTMWCRDLIRDHVLHAELCDHELHLDTKCLC